jgi:hypothetical protein
MFWNTTTTKPAVPLFNVTIIYKSGAKLELHNFEQFEMKGGNISWRVGDKGYPRIIRLGVDDISAVTYTEV